MFSAVEELKVPSDEWIKTLEDGRRVKFTFQDLPGKGRSSPLRLKATNSSIQSY